MRWICWVSVPLAVFGLTGPAAGFDSTLVAGGTCGGCEHCSGYCAPACGAPFFGWSPGCCQCQPSPCDNAWAGYCEEKARWRAFWYRLGTGGASYCTPVRADCGVPTCSSCPSQPAVLGPAPQAAPAGPPGADLPPLPEDQAGAPLPPKLGAPPVPLEPLGAPLPPALSEPPPPPMPDGPPLMPEPPDVREPSALPPVPRPSSEETTLDWNTFRFLRRTDRSRSTSWYRLR